MSAFHCTNEHNTYKGLNGVLLLVQFGYGSLPADVHQVTSPLSPTVHFGQILIKHLSRAQSGHQVIKLTALLLFIGFGFPRLLFPVFLQLERKTQIMTGEDGWMLYMYPQKEVIIRLCIRLYKQGKSGDVDCQESVSNIFSIF